MQVDLEDGRLRAHVIPDLDEDGFLLGVGIIGAAAHLWQVNLK